MTFNQSRHDIGRFPVLALASILTLAINPVHAGAQVDNHPFDVQDLVRLRRLTEPALSPDNRHIVYTLRETDLDADRGRTDLWLLDVNAPEHPLQLTTHPENDSSAQWAADGKSIYFLSSRSGSQQVWRIAPTGGEAIQVTDLPLDVTTFKVSPDDRWLALTLDVFPDCNEPACTAARKRERASSQAHGKVFDRLFVRHWDTWDDGTQSHLFVVPLSRARQDAPRDLMSTLDADVPSKPFGDASDYSFAPDGRTLAFSARIKGRSEAWSTNFDVYTVAVDGGALANLTADNPAWDAQPVFSHDGRWLAYRAMDRAGFESDRFHIVLVDRRSGAKRALAPHWDRSADALTFADDSRHLYALTDQRGQHVLWSVDVAHGEPKQLTDNGYVEAYCVGAHDVYFSRSSFTSPSELFALGHTGNAKQLTHVNAERLATVRMGAPEQFTFRGADNETVYAYIVGPADFDASKKYPVAFFVHGGPQVAFDNAWSYRWNPQTYAGAGFAFVSVDFHGSPGYGQRFVDSISGDWGGKPLIDLQKGLAAALARYPWLDKDRVCALGASFGGYMMNYIAGVWNAPFKCIVNHAGIFDSRMMAYTTEELWFDEWEHGGTPYDAPARYEQFNPIAHVKEWRVPMLLVDGENDFRVPYTQSLAAFTALQRRDIPSRLILFPDENHWILKPGDSIQWHQEVLRWLKRWAQ